MKSGCKAISPSGWHSASFRSVRGRTLIGAVLDETALWRSEESAQPDIEVLRAIKPALMRPAGAARGIVIGISTPYAQRGLLFEKSKFYGRDGDVLVVRGGTTTFNPLIDQSEIDKAIASDAEGNRAEYLAEFRGDWSAYVDRETVMRCVERDIRERPFEAGPRYEAFLDASSGRHDSLTLAIAHGKGQRVLLDVAYEWVAPFNPIEVTAEVAKALSRYRLTSVYGDSYAVGWVAAELKSNGINLRKAERDKSEIFLDGLPLLTSASVVLLDNQELITQLVNLQREVGKTGRDRIVKMRGFKDDLANAVMGAAVQVGLKRTESFAGEMDIDWAYGGAGTGRRQPKVLLGYAHSKPHAQQGWQDPFYRRKTKAELIELRRQPTTAPIDKHYVGPAGHYLDAVGNDGREQWGRYSPDGMLLGLTWGKEEAEAALTVVITNGKRSV